MANVVLSVFTIEMISGPEALVIPVVARSTLVT